MAPEWVSHAAMPFRNRAFGALALLAAVVATSACTPDTEELLAWLHDQSQAGIACTSDDLLRPDINLDAAQFVFGLQGWAAWNPTH